jgi:hypothetical protein
MQRRAHQKEKIESCPYPNLLSLEQEDMQEMALKLSPGARDGVPYVLRDIDETNCCDDVPD